MTDDEIDATLRSVVADITQAQDEYGYPEDEYEAYEAHIRAITQIAAQAKEANRLQRRLEIALEIALQVAQGKWTRENGVDVCAFCGVPLRYPAHTVEHRPSCATLTARALLDATPGA